MVIVLLVWNEVRWLLRVICRWYWMKVVLLLKWIWLVCFSDLLGFLGMVVLMYLWRLVRCIWWFWKKLLYLILG